MEGGQRLDESRQVAVALERAGVHCLNVGVGWHECRTPLVYMSVPRGNFVYLAEEIKKAVDIPVVAGYRINDPILADDIIAEGKADLVGMARALIADPDLPNKAREGRLDDIRPCIACGYCLDSVMLAAPMACAVNPEAGRETELSIAPAERTKNVYVIGGGPAGMEAATIAARRGHDVTLFEKGKKLGGNLLMAAVPSYKWEIENLIKYMEAQLQKSGAKVNLNTEADEATIARDKPDAVIVAIGSRPAVPDIPGVDGGNVATALEVLTSEKEVGHRVVVVGGGQVGCETAECLAERRKQVTILEMLPRLGSDIGLTTRWVIMQRLQQAGIATEAGVRVIEISDKGVKAERDGSIEFFEADSVVLAVGLTPDNGLSRRLEGKVAEVHCIGDCAEVQKIANAIEDGFRIAIEL
jgi:2,4-dienoyl-CoA reductase (NADPH2)